MSEPIRVGKHVSPIVITYRKVFRKPEYRYNRRFVGVRQLLQNVTDRLRAIAEEIAFEVTREVVDPGETKAVHWAINVAEPWEADTVSDLVAVHTHGIVPPGAMHFEVIEQVRPISPAEDDQAA